MLIIGRVARARAAQARGWVGLLLGSSIWDGLYGGSLSNASFFKQKTAYEIMSGDWSSDVCSSD
eukprot:COSAG06_NODE_44953_length_359_cov_0.369231_1_plen_63_part_01